MSTSAMITSASAMQTDHPAMRVEEIRLDHVKSIESLTVKPRSTGVTVIHGENESGKSTVIEAFNMLLANNPLKSNKGDIKALKSVSHDEKPEVQATLQIGEYHLTFKRVFAGASSKAELRIDAPRVENLTGSEAINRFQEILGEHSDEALRSSMSIKQGDILQLEELFKKNSLSQAIGRTGGQAEPSDGPSVADVVMDAQTLNLMDRAREVREKYFTQKSFDKWNSAFEKRIQQLESAREELRDAEARLAEAERYAMDVEKSTASLKRLELEKLAKQERLVELEQQQELALTRSKEQEQAQQALDAAKQAVASLKAEQNKRQQLLAEIQRLEEAGAQLSTAVAKKKADAEKEEARLEAKRQATKRDRLELDVALAARELVRSRADLRRIGEDIEALSASIDKAKELDKRIQELKKTLAGNEISTDVLSDIDALHRDYRVASARRDAAATTVRISGPEGTEISDGTSTATLGTEGWETKVGSARTFTLGEFSVEVAPAGAAEDLDDAVTYAQQRLVSALAKAGVDSADLAAESDTERDEKFGASISRLRQQAIERQDVARDVEDATNKRRELLGAVSTQQRTAELEDLKQRQVKLETAVASNENTVKKGHREFSSFAGDDDLSLEQLLSLEVVDDQWVDQLRQRITSSESTDGTSTDGLKAEVTDLETQVSTNESVRALRLQDLAEAREAKTDESLAAALEAAELSVEQAEAKSKDLSGALEGADSPDMIAMKLKGMRTALRTIEHQTREEERKIDIARHEIEQAGGTAEEVQEAEAEVNRVESAIRSAQKQAEAANLLVQLMTDAHDDLMVQYQAPFLNEFTKLAKNIFGSDVSFELSNDLAVTKRIIGGEGIELGQLSGGATEQIAMLYRLAAASLMGRGESVPIFLDDTLGYTDEYRAENMNAVLAMMGRDHQIIVTTCDSRRFSSIQGSEVVSMDSLKR